jgi:integral membrane protein (TIGR01906 family)
MPGRLASFVVATATAFVILGASIVPFANPAYVRVEQDRTGVGSLTGLEPSELDTATNAILGDLFLWQGDFDEVAGPRLMSLLNEREIAHMRDVRGAFLGFELLVLASIAVLIVAFRRATDAGGRAATWRAVGRGARGLAIGVVVVGAFAAFAFDAAFEVFHRLFFSAGSYTFDPRTDRLVQLFPEQFWSETAIAVGVVSLAVALLVAWLAGRRAGSRQPGSVLAASKVRP